MKIGTLLARLAIISARGATPRLSDAAQWAERVRLRIEHDLGAHLPLQAVLGDLGLSYRQLARLFRDQTGMSPKAYQLQRRIAEAKHLLCETELPALSIALELGFPSAQHFATQFRKVVGMSPSRYRQAR